MAERKTIDGALEELLDSDDIVETLQTPPKSGAARIAHMLFKKALEEEDMKAMQAILDRTGGKAGVKKDSGGDSEENEKWARLEALR